MSEDAYYRELEKLLLDLARFYQQTSILTNHQAAPP